MQVNLIRIESQYTNKKGEKRTGFDFYLECGESEIIAIQPKWLKDKNGNYNPTDNVRLRAYSTLRERK